MRRRNVLGFLAASGLSACSAFEVVNSFVPRTDFESAIDLRYGPGTRDRLDIYRPPGLRPGLSVPAPVVIFFYGGNWHSGSRSDYLFVGEALASRGMVAVLPDYRLYPEVRFPAFLDDCARAVAWTLGRIGDYGGDPHRVFLMGHSAGAYNAAMLALDAKYLRAAGSDAASVRGLIGLAGPYDFIPIKDPIARIVFGFPDTPRSTQPIEFAGRSSPPALLITAQTDEVVDPGNSARLASRLEQAGVSVRQKTYSRVNHSTLAGALAAPLRLLAPVLDDVDAFVKGLQ
jgi:acetyl esterase/lipase